jgi:uracil-DNA glycosylase family protein
MTARCGGYGPVVISHDRVEMLDDVRKDAAHCTNCDLYRNATQTVFGEGPASARLMLVGEQPGDREDLAGHPFVGPAGAVLDRALRAAGIPRSEVYVTNAVKHFRFEQRGKRRIHQKPNTTQIVACRPWLDAELKLVDPETVVCLGVTAATAVFGKAATISKLRGRSHDVGGRRVVVTIHPSALLRVTDEDERAEATDAFVDDLRLAAS